MICLPFTTMPPSKRDHLVDTARKLFQRDGFHNTGIDAILAEAGVAKMTLYKHFKSKDELILAVLRRQDEELRNHLMRRVEKDHSEPRDRMLGLFDVIADQVNVKEYCGCLFINASAEYSTPDSPIHRAALEHKRLCLTYVERLATDAGAARPHELARQICLLAEGVMVSAQVSGECVTDLARRAAELLIDAATSAPA
jgi:AcrR family transcriptional regulator